MGIFLWILGSTIVFISLLLLSLFEGKTEELRESIVFPDGSFTALVTDTIAPPKERLKQLERKLSSKSNKFEISQEKLNETKKTISELEVTSGEVQKKYKELLGQLKSELAKTEIECHNLHNQIEQITTKRDKLKQELDQHQSQFPGDAKLDYSQASLLSHNDSIRKLSPHNQTEM